MTAGPAKSAAKAWLSHELVFKNTSHEVVYVDAARTSQVLGDPGSFIAGTGGCGYTFHRPDGPATAGACRASLEAPMLLQPGTTTSRLVTLWRDLPGLASPAPGAYTFTLGVRYHVGEPTGAARDDRETWQRGLVRITYTVQ